MTYDLLSLAEAESRINTFPQEGQWEWYATLDEIANLPEVTS